MVSPVGLEPTTHSLKVNYTARINIDIKHVIKKQTETNKNNGVVL